MVVPYVQVYVLSLHICLLLDASGVPTFMSIVLHLFESTQQCVASEFRGRQLVVYARTAL